MGDETNGGERDDKSERKDGKKEGERKKDEWERQKEWFGSTVKSEIGLMTPVKKENLDPIEHPTHPPYKLD